MTEIATGKTFTGFGTFLKKNRWAILIAFLVVLISYGFMLTHYTLSIDEEIWVKNTDPELLKSIWLNQGHFGLFFFDSLFFPNGNYVPVLWDWLGVIQFTFAGVIFAFAASQFLKNIGRFSVFIFCAVFPVFPFVTGDILSFSMYGLPMGIAMIVMSLAVLLFFVWCREHKPFFLIASAILAFVATSFYQAFPGIYVVGVMMYVVIALSEKIAKPVRIVKDVLWGILALAIAVGGYFLVNQSLQSLYGLAGSGGYLSEGFIGWGTTETLAIFGGIARSIGASFAGRIYGGAAVLIVTVLFVIYMITGVLRKKEGKTVWIIGCLLLLVSPFVMNLMLGSQELIGRTLLGFPLALAAEALLIAEAVRKSETRWLRISASVALCCVLAINGVYMNLLFWMDHTAYRKDRTTSAQIMDEINRQEIDSSKKPVIFVGKLESVFPGNLNTPATASFFNWDGGSNYRIHGFMNAEGHVILPYTTEQLGQAVEAAKSLPGWPQEGSVKELNDCIVVKLSDPPESSWLDRNKQIG